MSIFKVALLGKKELAKFQKYIRLAFHPKYILGDPRYPDWQYNGQIFVIKDGEEIIGHFGFRDLNYKIYNRSLPVRVLMNLFVLEPYRLAGAAALLSQEVFRTDNQFLVSGYTDRANKLFSHFRPNWQNAGDLKRYFMILGEAAPNFWTGRPWSRSIEKSISHSNAEAVVKFDASWEEFWEKIRSRYPVAVERTRNYLNWRFLQHPFFQYRILAAKIQNRLAGYLVWRLEENQGFWIGRIIDFISEEQAESGLLAAFLAEAKKAGAMAADFLFSGSFYQNSLEANGFFDVAGTDFADFPILFSPISKKKSAINIGYNFKAPLADCFFTKADGDQDRPNPY